MRLKRQISIYIIFASVLSLGFFLSSCDTRKDYFKDVNKAPEVLLRKLSSTNQLVHLTDSMKLSQGFYSFSFLVIDEQQGLPVSPSMLAGAGNFSIDNIYKTIKFTPTKAQEAKFLISASDIYTTTVDTVDLVVFTNLLPVANYTVTNTKVNSPYECNINAIASYDKDAAYGGKIVQYEYHVGAVYTVVTSLSNINYVFPSSGNYNIKVRVQDNDGAWSDFNSIVYPL